MVRNDTKRVELTTIKQNSGRPITSFLDYSPRTIDPPKIDDNGFFNANLYASYLAAYDTYLVKFFQVRRQFLSLLREGAPAVDLVVNCKSKPAEDVLPYHQQAALGKKGVDCSQTITVGDLVRPLIPVVNAPAPAPPSEEHKKEVRRQARKRRAARKRNAKKAAMPKEVHRKIDLIQAQTTLAKVEAGWTKVISRKEKRQQALLAKQAARPSSSGIPPGSKESTPLRRSTAVRRKPKPSGSG